VALLAGGLVGTGAAAVEQPVILFDYTHIDPTADANADGSPDYQPPVYSEYRADLATKGYDVREALPGTSFTNQMAGVNILVIVTADIDYNTNEIKLIKDFVKGGGGLFLINDYGGAGPSLDRIAQQFGITYASYVGPTSAPLNTYIVDTDDYTGPAQLYVEGYGYVTVGPESMHMFKQDGAGIIKQNPAEGPYIITEGVNSVWFYTSNFIPTGNLPAGATVLVKADSDYSTYSPVTGDNAKGAALVVAVENEAITGKGAIVTIGDGNPLSKKYADQLQKYIGYYDGSNAKLATNIIDYLAQAADIVVRDIDLSNVQEGGITIPGEGITLEFLVTNLGTEDDTISIDVDPTTIPSGWVEQLQYTSVFLEPAEDRVVTVTFYPAMDAEVGVYEDLKVIGTSSDGVTTDEITFDVEITKSSFYGVNVKLDDLEVYQHVIGPGGNTTYNITVTNIGNEPDTINIDTNVLTGSSPPWTLEILDGWTQLVLDPTESQTITIKVNGPTIAEDGERLRFEVEGRSVNDPLKFSNALALVTIEKPAEPDVRFRINHYDADLQGIGDDVELASFLMEKISKDTAPGATEYVVIEALNAGGANATIHMSASIGSPGWMVRWAGEGWQGGGSIQADARGYANVINATDVASLTADFAGQKWNAELSESGVFGSGGFTYLTTDRLINVIMIDVPQKVAADEKGIVRVDLLFGDETFSKTVEYQVVAEHNGTWIEPLDVEDPKPGELFTFDFQLHNTGNYEEDLRVQVIGPLGWDLGLDFEYVNETLNDTLHLNIGSKRYVRLAGEIPGGTLAGTYVISLSASNTMLDLRYDYIIYIPQAHSIEIEVEKVDTATFIGGAISNWVNITNLGNGPEWVNLSYFEPKYADWSTFNDTILIGPGNTTAVEFFIYTDREERGTEFTLTLNTYYDNDRKYESIPILIHIRKPDLYVEELALSKEQTTVGDFIIVSTRIYNYGEVTANNVTIALQENGEEVESKYIQSLYPGGIGQSMTFFYPVKEGKKTLSVYADPDDVFEEGNDVLNPNIASADITGIVIATNEQQGALDQLKDNPIILILLGVMGVMGVMTRSIVSRIKESEEDL